MAHVANDSITVTASALPLTLTLTLPLPHTEHTPRFRAYASASASAYGGSQYAVKNIHSMQNTERKKKISPRLNIITYPAT